MKNIRNKITTSLASFLWVSFISFSTIVSADDTEVFYSVNVSKPNLLFLLDFSGSMLEYVDEDDTEKKEHIVNREVSSPWADGYQMWGNNGTGGPHYLWGWSLVFDNRRMNAVRFSNLSIPKGAKITKAYVQFTAARRDKSDAEMNVYVENSSNADSFYWTNQFTGWDRIIGANRTLFPSITWDVPNWRGGQKTAAQRTPDLKDYIQAIIDKNEWSPDNGIAILIDGVKGMRRAKSFNWGGNRPSHPELHVEYETQEGKSKTRLEVMQSAVRRVLADAPSNVNVGLMKYSSQEYDVYNNATDENHRRHNVGGVAFPITDINAFAAPVTDGFDDRDNLPDPTSRATVRSYLAAIVDTWDAYGSTPIVDSLYEAALYFRGEEMHYGKDRNNTDAATSGLATRPGRFFSGSPQIATGSHPSTYVGGAEIDKTVGIDGRSSITDAKYISPITSSCQANYIVLMSDGAASGGEVFAAAVSGDLDYEPLSKSDLTVEFKATLKGGVCTKHSGTFGSSGTCGSELTKFLAEHDQSPHKDKQTIKTFTIGFGKGLGVNDKKYLKDLATYVGKSPNYYDADDEDTLAAAFRKILSEVSQPSGTLASPGYSVNIKSGLSHERDIYIPVFDRKNSSVWSGNLKKFKIAEVDGSRVIHGSNDKDAVDELGGFTNDAHDLWSKSPSEDGSDGKDILKGGVASLLDDPDSRLLVSNLTSDKDLTASDNLLTPDNSKITGDLLGFTNNNADSQRPYLINFIRGWKEGDKGKNQVRKHMGDMLHSEPLVITYKKADDKGNGKEQYLFAATNEGYLHAIDTVTGKEKFAFMPKELLKNIDPQFQEAGTAKDHKYGIDGTLTYWKNDDHVYLYFGLRRGGRSYYALDITDIEKPKILWVKTASTSPSDALSTLGQSWSAPYLARVGMEDGTKKEVIIVTGGYDPEDDRDDLEASEVITATKGNDVFIFDAIGGDLIWSLRNNVKNTDIVNSIPGGARILDINKNGLVDRLYFADTGGNIWRLDLSEKLGSKNAHDTESKLVKLAALGGEEENARKFYNEPDVSVMRPSGKTIFAVSVGSGFRAHPMNKFIEDRFFVIKDVSPYSPLKTTGKGKYEAITLSGLAEVEVEEAAGGEISVTQVDFDDALKVKKGWSVKLPADGEKVLATSVTFNGSVVFTTLVPKALTEGEGIDQCAAPATYGRLYAIDILSGKAGLNLKKEIDETDLTDNDIVTVPISKVIPGKPHLIFNPPSLDEEKDADGKVINTLCVHEVDIRVGKRKSQVSGYDACKLESLYWSDPER